MRFHAFESAQLNSVCKENCAYGMLRSWSMSSELGWTRAWALINNLSLEHTGFEFQVPPLMRKIGHVGIPKSHENDVIKEKLCYQILLKFNEPIAALFNSLLFVKMHLSRATYNLWYIVLGHEKAGMGNEQLESLFERSKQRFGVRCRDQKNLAYRAVHLLCNSLFN